MTVDSTGATARGGVRTALDIVIAPKAAFDALRVFPTWGWALLLSVAGMVLGAYLMTPAYQHVVDASGAATLLKNPQIAKLPADQQSAQVARIIAMQHSFASFNVLVVPIAGTLGFALQALIMLAARVVGKGEGGYRRFWALACNAGIVGTGLGTLAIGLICTLRGPASFNSTADLQSALPSLALFVPGASAPITALLSSVNVFYVWAAALLGLGMIRTGRISAPVAWGTATIFVLVPGCFAALASRGT